MTSLKEERIPFLVALFININIMIGAGVFLNTVELSKRAGILACLAYLSVGILMFPLIASIAQLVRLYPVGGFYTYAREELGLFAGFISAWSYFIGKLGSATLLMYTAVVLLQQIIPAAIVVSPFLCTVGILTLFIVLNTLNLKTSETIQGWLFVFKLIPLFFVIFTGLYLLNPTDIAYVFTNVPDTLSTIPLVLFAFLGFEATCSISSKIENAQYNGPRAILYSYAIVICIYILFQLLFFTSVGSQLMQASSFTAAFPLLIAKIAPNYQTLFCALLNIFIASSALGGSYGILFSNSWNAHILAEKNLLPFSSFFKKLNSNGIPYRAVFLEGAICLLYLFVSQATVVALQLTSVLGSIIAYSLSVIALYAAHRRGMRLQLPAWAILLALGNCLILLGASMKLAYNLYLLPISGFITLFIAGVAYAVYARKQGMPQRNQ